MDKKRQAARRRPSRLRPASLPPQHEKRLAIPEPDYDAEDVLVVREPEQLRALGDDLRTRLVMMLRSRAASTSELAQALDLPKGTVGHHLKVLEKAGLIRVVRTRQVRAMTEKYYGRVARLFVLRGDEPEGVTTGGIAAALLRQAAEEVPEAPLEGDLSTFSLMHVRLAEGDARRFIRRLERLYEDFGARENAGGRTFTLVTGLFPPEGKG
jgi:DNA-binding transcriptional ArsR family regulator